MWRKDRNYHSINAPRYIGYGLSLSMPTTFNTGAVTPNTGVTGPTATFMWDPSLMFGPQPDAPAADAPPPADFAPAADGVTGPTATFTFNSELYNTGAKYSPFNVQSPFTGGAPARDGGDALRTSAPAAPTGTNTGLTQPQYQMAAGLPGQQAQYGTGGAKLPPVPSGGASGCPAGYMADQTGKCVDPNAECAKTGRVFCQTAQGYTCCDRSTTGGAGAGTGSSTAVMAAGAAALAALFLLR